MSASCLNHLFALHLFINPNNTFHTIIVMCTSEYCQLKKFK